MTSTKISSYPEEWYRSFEKCLSCGEEFMCSNSNYCPCCGEPIEKTICTDNMCEEREE